jgi:RimJ/RimL family protein N-acetyltransferase
MRLEVGVPGIVVRPWRAEDASSLAHHADNRKVWLNLRDAFPHPYRLADAEAFIDRSVASVPVTNFAIEVDGVAGGGIGFKLGTDIERIRAELGYWLGEPFWGRGIMSAVVRATSRWGAGEFGLARVFAVPFAENGASARVLAKAGFVLEGTMRRSAIKDGRVLDQLLFALVTAEAVE